MEQFNYDVVNDFNPLSLDVEYDLYAASPTDWFNSDGPSGYQVSNNIKSFFFVRDRDMVLDAEGNIIGSNPRRDPDITYADVGVNDEMRICTPCKDTASCLQCKPYNEKVDTIPRKNADAWFEYVTACTSTLRNCHKCPPRFADVNATAYMFKNTHVAEVVGDDDKGCEYLIGNPLALNFCSVSRNKCPVHCGHIEPIPCPMLISLFRNSLLYLRNWKNGETRLIGNNFPDFDADVDVTNAIIREHVQNVRFAKAICDNLPQLAKCPTFCAMEGFNAI